MRFIAHTFSMGCVRVYFVPCSRFILNLEPMYMLSCGFQNGGLRYETPYYYIPKCDQTTYV